MTTFKKGDYVYHRYIPNGPMMWVRNVVGQSPTVITDCLDGGLGAFRHPDVLRLATPAEILCHKIGNQPCEVPAHRVRTVEIDRINGPEFHDERAFRLRANVAPILAGYPDITSMSGRCVKGTYVRCFENVKFDPSVPDGKTHIDLYITDDDTEETIP